MMVKLGCCKVTAETLSLCGRWISASDVLKIKVRNLSPPVIEKIREERGCGGRGTQI
jgi:hypothetical protein